MARQGRAFAPGLIALVPVAQYPQGGIGLERNLARNVVGRTAAAQLTGIDDYVPVDASAGAVTLTLPNGDGAGTTTLNLGAEYVILKTDATNTPVTIAPATWSVGTDRINGSAAPLVLRQQYAGYVLVLRAGGVLNVSNGDWMAYPLVPGSLDERTLRKIATPLTPYNTGVNGEPAIAISGWGTGGTAPSYRCAVGLISNDLGGQIEVTAGDTAISANPTVTITFKDGAWALAPWTLVTRSGNYAASWGVSSRSPTAVQLMYNGTPASLSTSRFEYLNFAQGQ